jgi:predicted RNase H-like HicB family nuclease
MRHGVIDDVAEAIGTTPAKLFAQLRAGKSIADVAKANGKSLADVRAAAKAAIKAHLDKAVKDEDLTQKQADAMLEHIDEKLAAIVSDKPLRFRRHLKPRTGGEVRPGALKPGDEVQESGASDGFYN